MNAIFKPLNMGFKDISRSRFIQSKYAELISFIYVMGCFVNVGVCLEGSRIFFIRFVKFIEEILII